MLLHIVTFTKPPFPVWNSFFFQHAQVSHTHTIYTHTKTSQRQYFNIRGLAHIYDENNLRKRIRARLMKRNTQAQSNREKKKGNTLNDIFSKPGHRTRTVNTARLYHNLNYTNDPKIRSPSFAASFSGYRPFYRRAPLEPVKSPSSIFREKGREDDYWSTLIENGTWASLGFSNPSMIEPKFEHFFKKWTSWWNEKATTSKHRKQIDFENYLKLPGIYYLQNKCPQKYSHLIMQLCVHGILSQSR